MDFNFHMPQMEEIKAHVKKNKNAYIVGGCGIVFSGVVYYFGARSGSPRVLSPKASIFGINNKLDQKVIQIVDRSGPPSWITYWIEQDLEFDSQRLVSAATGLSESHISKQLNGKRIPVDGVTLVRKGLAAA